MKSKLNAKTRFQFSYVQLKELLLEKPRNGLYKSEKYQGSGNRWIKMKTVFDNRVISEQQMDLIQVTKDEEEKFSCKNDDLIFSRTSILFEGVGKCCLVHNILDKPIFESNTFVIRLDKSKSDPKFYFYYFNSPQGRQNIYGIIRQTAASQITSADLIGLSVPYPPLEIQNRVSSIMFKLEKLITTLENQNKILEKLTQSIFKSWFIDFDGQTKFVDSELGEIPKGWNVATLNDVCSLITDGSHFSPKEDSTGTKRIATVKNMKEYDIDIQSCKKISNEDYKNLVKNGCKPQKTDILFSKDGTMGIVHLFNGEENLVLLSSIAILRLNEKISNYYLKSYLSEEENQHILKEDYSSGSALPRIVLKDLKKFEIIVPTKEILKKFDLMVIPSYKQIFQNSKNCRVLKKVRDLLLQKLISGEIQV